MINVDRATSSSDTPLPLLLIRQWSDDVVYFAHLQAPTDDEASRLAARGIHIIHGRVSRLVVEDDIVAAAEPEDESARMASAPW